ncbi:MAG TPA: GntR family transcriptional regulator, partial [Bacillota bacterium]|nr:GntR family transcriptional regulator [Bacillota bacterium]
MINFDIHNHKPLREVVYEELKLLILTGKISPGTRMMEVELAEEMGVSRTPVREAIRKLE